MKLAFLFFTIGVMCAQLPIDPKGKLHPYMTTVTVQATGTVTTVFTVKYLRVIEVSADGTNTFTETNYVALRTNVLSVTSTNTNVMP